MENTGNSYRTRQAVSICGALIALAVTVLLVGVYGVSLIVGAGAFLLIIGALIAIISLSFDGTADKFGPSERDFRLIVGLVVAIIGITAMLVGYDTNIYVTIAVLIIGIAIIGLLATFRGNRSSKY